MGYKVAVAGATGNVGREMLTILAERAFPADEVVALASRRSQGIEVSFGDSKLKVKALEHYDFSDVDICLMSAGSAVSKEWSPRIAAAGAVVIDNSSCWRYDADVPLIVPEVNAAAIAGFRRKGIIANPNCSTAQLVVALKPLHDKARITRVVVATYQSVSGAGRDAMDELFAQTKSVYTLDEVAAKKFPKRIAFNLIPHIDVFMEDGFTKEEWKMVAETKKILDPKIKLVATCVRVPVFVGHSEAVNIEFEDPISAEEAREILRNAPGCLVIDKREPGGYATPYEAVGEDATYISRIREDPTVENGLVLWCVADNLRKGAALNAVQIAECLLNRKLIEAKRKAA
ncbi:MAG TPA: aspartate-semialdehyde dehydrogenase [Xanthobacteraceae bacterium]|jgi:aspartate-semialdehyde dehydrogenase